MNDKRNLFAELRKHSAEAIVLNRDQDGVPSQVVVPVDFSPPDIINCLRSFGFEATLGEIEDIQDPIMGDYCIVSLENVQEYLPPEASVPQLMADRVRGTLKRGLTFAAELAATLAKKV